MFHNLASEMTQVIGGAIKASFAQATQSIAPVEVRTIPLTQVVERVVPSGVPPVTTSRVPTTQTPAPKAPPKALPVVPQSGEVVPPVALP